MVKSGQSRIRPVDFESPLDPRLPVEAIERRELLERVDTAELAAPQRPSFEAFLLFRTAGGTHTVDFAPIEAASGRMVRIRPGQTMRWDTDGTFDAILIMAEPAVPGPVAWFPGDAAHCDLDRRAADSAEQLVRVIRNQQAAFADNEPGRRLMRHLFEALAALFEHAAQGPAKQRLPDAFVAFRSALESDLRRWHHVSDYARELGYSARTISRACRSATGLSAKRVLTDRLVLEAKRMLVHTEAPAADIGHELGFTDPTNFSKFFARNTGQSPGVFRRHVQSSSSAMAGMPG